MALLNPIIIPDCGLYNQSGMNFGFGDITLKSVLGLHDALKNGDLFIVIGKSAVKPGATNSFYLASHCKLIIGKTARYVVEDSLRLLSSYKTVLSGLSFVVISRGEARFMIARAQEYNQP